MEYSIYNKGKNVYFFDFVPLQFNQKVDGCRSLPSRLYIRKILDTKIGEVKREENVVWNLRSIEKSQTYILNRNGKTDKRIGY